MSSCRGSRRCSRPGACSRPISATRSVRTHIGDARRVGAAAAPPRVRAHGGRRAAAAGRGLRGAVRVERAVDMRYGEQVFEVKVPLAASISTAPDAMAEVVDRFHKRHEELYTYSRRRTRSSSWSTRGWRWWASCRRCPRSPRLPARPPAPPRSRRRVYLGEWARGAGLRPGRAGAGAGDRGPRDRRDGDDDGAPARRATAPSSRPSAGSTSVSHRDSCRGARRRPSSMRRADPIRCGGPPAGCRGRPGRRHP